MNPVNTAENTIVIFTLRLDIFSCIKAMTLRPKQNSTVLKKKKKNERSMHKKWENSLKRLVIAVQCSTWTHEWHWSVRAIKRAKRGDGEHRFTEQWPGPVVPHSCKEEGAGEGSRWCAPSALHHFAACRALLRTPKISDVRSDECGSDRFIPASAKGESSRDRTFDRKTGWRDRNTKYCRAAKERACIWDVVKKIYILINVVLEKELNLNGNHWHYVLDF